MKIPAGEDFGNVVARGPRYNEQQIPMAAFGTPITDAVTRNAENMVKQERDLRDAADKATALTRMQMAEQDLAGKAEDIANRVATGSLDKTTAADEWRAQADDYSRQALDGIAQQHRSTVEGHLAVTAKKLDRMVVSRGIAARDREDIRAGLMDYLEGQERFAVTDREKATKSAMYAIEQLAPHAGYGPADITKISYGFRERVAANTGQSMVRGASGDLAALDAAAQRLQGDEFADLTPEKRGALENQILARKTFLETQEQRRIVQAEAAAARRAREAEDAYKATQTIIDNGGLPHPDFLDQVSMRTAGTPYSAPLTSLLQQAKERSGFAALSPQEQQAQLLEMRARANTEGTNPAYETRMRTLEKIASESQRQLNEDPLIYGVNRRLIDAVEPISTSNPQQLLPQLQLRTEQAATVSARVGRPVSPLLKSEAEQLAQTVGMLPVPQQVSMVRQWANVLEPRQAQALARQISAKDDTLGLAMFLSANAQRAPRDPAELVLRGADAIKSGRLKPASSDSVAREDHREIAEQLSQVTWATTQARDAAISASQHVYDGLRDTGKRSVREAINLGTGGIGEWAGSKVPVPYGMTPREFRRAMEGMDPKRVEEQAGGAQVFVGGKPLEVSALVKNLEAVRLIPAGAGNYALESGGQLVLTSRGIPLRITVGD